MDWLVTLSYRKFMGTLVISCQPWLYQLVSYCWFRRVLFTSHPWKEWFTRNGKKMWMKWGNLSGYLNTQMINIFQVLTLSFSHQAALGMCNKYTFVCYESIQSTTACQVYTLVHVILITAMMSPILQMRKPRLREVQWHSE